MTIWSLGQSVWGITTDKKLPASNSTRKNFVVVLEVFMFGLWVGILITVHYLIQSHVPQRFLNLTISLIWLSYSSDFKCLSIIFT